MLDENKLKTNWFFFYWKLNFAWQEYLRSAHQCQSEHKAQSQRSTVLERGETLNKQSYGSYISLYFWKFSYLCVMDHSEAQEESTSGW